MTILTQEQKALISKEVLSIIQADLDSSWKSVLSLAVENTGLDSVEFDDGGEEATVDTFDLLYQDGFLTLSWDTDNQSNLDLRLTYQDDN